MYRYAVFLFLFLILPLYAPGENFIFPYPYRETVLENGLRVILVPMKNEGLVSYVTAVNVGSRDEVEEGKTGFAHFFEHMMFRGTKKYPAEEYDQAISEMGADLNAFTGDDWTVYYMHFPARFLEKVIDLESDRFQNLEYSLPAFQTEAKAILGEYNKNFANPFFQLEETLNATAFHKSTYGHTTMGYLKDIEAMPEQFDYSLQFFDRFYRPEKSTILVSGSFDPDTTLALIRRYYSDWKKGSYQTVNPEEPKQTEERRSKVDYQGDTLPILTVSVKIPAFSPSNQDHAALSLLADLAFGETSELYQRLVLQEQKVDFIGADITPHLDPYLMTVYARLKKEEDLKAVEESVTATFRQMMETPVDEKRLSDLKSNRKYGFLMSLDTSKSLVQGMYSGKAPFYAMVRGMKGVDELFRTYESITPKNIQKVAQEYCSEENRTIIHLTGAKS